MERGDAEPTALEDPFVKNQGGSPVCPCVISNHTGMGRYTPDRGEGTGAGWVWSKSVHLKTRTNAAIKVPDKRCCPSPG